MGTMTKRRWVPIKVSLEQMVRTVVGPSVRGDERMRRMVAFRSLPKDEQVEQFNNKLGLLGKS